MRLLLYIITPYLILNHVNEHRDCSRLSGEEVSPSPPLGRSFIIKQLNTFES